MERVTELLKRRSGATASEEGQEEWRQRRAVTTVAEGLQAQIDRAAEALAGHLRLPWPVT